MAMKHNSNNKSHKMRGCFKLTFFSSNMMGISEQGRKVIQGQHPTAALPSFFAEMRNHFPVTTGKCLQNGLLTSAKLKRFGQIPWNWKTARCKNHCTHSGGEEMQTSSRWSEILAAITILDVELTARDFSYRSCKSLGGTAGLFYSHKHPKIEARSCRDFRCRGGSVPEVGGPRCSCQPAELCPCAGCHPLLTWKRTATAECCTLSENPRCL